MTARAGTARNALPSRTREDLKTAVDLTIWTAAAPLAFALRMLPAELHLQVRTIVLYTVLGIPVKFFLARVWQLHRQAWRTATVHDLKSLIYAVSMGTAVLFAAGFQLVYRLSGFARTIPLVEGALAILGIGGIRLVARLAYERRVVVLGDATRPGAHKRVLLIGAGDGGARVAHELHRHPATGIDPVGFLDDDPAKERLSIMGLKVLGKIEDLPRIVARESVDQVLISMPSASGSQTRRVVDLAQAAHVELRILPGMTEILAGDVRLSRIRDVQVDDLLRRRPLELELPAGYVSGRTVLVTGAGGSIGSELVRQVARFDPGMVVLMGRGENSLHAIQQELLRDAPSLNQQIVVGDIRDPSKVADVFHRYSPDVVFHAAAHKHVPLMESHPDEAVLNNIGGTRNLAEAARMTGVRRFVNISTDKAVNPVSMVGVTKSLAEQVVRAIADEADQEQSFVSVRFGNVLGSRGSVVPLFQDQIRRGGPVMVTHADMTRYFMTIPEASRLVIQAGGIARNGAVYVLDMGTPVRIEDLARDMIRLSGADPEEVQVVFTGLRPGERLHEELFTEEEQMGATHFEQIMEARTEDAPSEFLLNKVELLVRAAAARNWGALETFLGQLVPGFAMKERAALMPLRYL